MRTNKLKKERPTMTSIPGNSKRLIVLIKFMSNIKILKWQKRKKKTFSLHFFLNLFFYTNHSGSKILQNFHFKTFFAKAAKHSDCCKKNLKALNSL